MKTKRTNEEIQRELELFKEKYFDEHVNFGKKLKNLLHSHKISNETLKNLLECSDQTISDQLNGKTKKPFWMQTVRLIKYLQDEIEGFDISWLLEENNNLEEKESALQVKTLKHEIQNLKQNVRNKEKACNKWKSKYCKVNKKNKKYKAFIKKHKNINIYALFHILKYYEKNYLLPIFYSLLTKGNLTQWIENVRNYTYFRVEKFKLKDSPQALEEFKFNKAGYEQLTKFMLEEYLQQNPNEYDDIMKELRIDINDMKWNDNFKIDLKEFKSKYSRVEENQTINPMYGIGETISPEHYNENQKISKLE